MIQSKFELTYNMSEYLGRSDNEVHQIEDPQTCN